MGKVINVGLIGFGLAGRVFHAPIIAGVEDMKLAMIFERKDENTRFINNKYPEAVVVSDVKDIIENDAIDVVVVASTNQTHFSIARDALKANKHVVVEKPFTITSEEAEELIELSKERNRVLTVHQNRRWDSDFRTVKKVIEGGLLGNIVEYEAHFDRYRNFIKDSWREENIIGSGILYDLGSHLIDQALSIFGMPKSLYGDLRVQRENAKNVDNFEIILNYEKTKVTLKGGMLVKEPGPHFVIQGDQGTFVKYGMDVQEDDLKAGLSPGETDNWGLEPEELWGTLNVIHKGLNIRGKVESELGDYRGFYRNVKEAILGNEALEVLPEHGRNTMKITELVIKSNEEKRVINVD